MKVVHIGSNSIHVQHYVENLSKRGVQNSLISEENCGFTGIENELVVSYRKLSFGNLRRNRKAVKQFLEGEKPDVVHIHQLTRLAYFTAKVVSSLKIPILSTAWGSDVLIVPQQNKFYKYLVTKTIQRSSMVTADADSMIIAMKQLVNDPERYRKVQYGIDFAETNGVIKESIIFSNRLHKPLYRIDKIVHYFAEAHQQFPELKLVIGATGEETDKLKTMVHDAGLTDVVEFVGWLTPQQNQEFYTKSKYYISIPESDGTSVSLLEAISANCIPVVSDLPSNREWVTDAKTGIIEQNGENPILSALKFTFNSDCEKNAENVRSVAGREACITQFMNFYGQCIGK